MMAMTAMPRMAKAAIVHITTPAENLFLFGVSDSSFFSMEERVLPLGVYIYFAVCQEGSVRVCLIVEWVGRSS